MSNPNHFMEFNPMLKLICSDGFTDDHRKDLVAYPDIGYKTPARINLVFEIFKLYICKGLLPDHLEGVIVSLDYFMYT